jgi:hypothetical protein
MSHELKTKRPASATKPPKAIVHLAFGSVPVVDDGVKERLRAAAKRPRSRQYPELPEWRKTK